MMSLLRRPTVQIVLCVAVYGLLAWKFGPFAAVILAPGLAAAVARPIINLTGSLHGDARELVWKPALGQHYAYKGITIHVLEDDDYQCWIPLADLRKVMPRTPVEATLAIAYPGRVQRVGDAKQVCLRDDAVIEHLGKQTDPAAIKFRNWVEKDVASPARRRRQHRGIREPVTEED